MAKPITLITGEPFLVDQEIRKWTTAFAGKYGAESIFVFKEHPLPTKQIIATMTGGGLFASKSCIIVHGLPLSTDDKKSAKEKEEIDQFTQWFVDNYSSISPDNIILFISHNPDKRGKLYKIFDSANTDSNLGIISRKSDQGSVLDLIKQQLGQRCPDTQCQYIAEVIGSSDLYRIWYETSKIQDYIAFHQLTSIENSQIQSIITPHIDQDSFAVIDSILYKGSDETLKLIDRLQQVDDNPYGFLGLLYRGLRGVIMTVDAMNHNITNSGQLMSLTKLPPFTIGRITKQYSTLKNKIDGLTSLFSSLIQLEYEIKTGIVPVELFWPQVKVLVKQAQIQ